MQFAEFDQRLLSLFRKHQEQEIGLDAFITSMLSTLIVQVPDNSLLLFQVVEQSLKGPLDDLRRRFLEEFLELLLELRRGQGH